MRTRSMLRNARHRAMITSVSVVCTKIIHINPSFWKINRSFEIIFENENCPQIGIQIQCSIQMHCLKKTSDVNYILIPEGSSGSNG